MLKLVLLLGLTLVFFVITPATFGFQDDVDKAKLVLAKLKEIPQNVTENGTCNGDPTALAQLTSMVDAGAATTDPKLLPLITTANVTDWDTQADALVKGIYCDSTLKCANGTCIKVVCGKKAECVSGYHKSLEERIGCWTDACPQRAGGNKFEIPGVIFVVTLAFFNLRFIF